MAIWKKPDISRLINLRSMSLLTTCRAFIPCSRYPMPDEPDAVRSGYHQPPAAKRYAGHAS